MTRETKAAHREAIRNRAADAIRNLYHNATPDYPDIDHESESEAFDSWFSGTAEFEIEYLQSGGVYGRNYRKCLESNAANRCKSERARRYYVAKRMRDMERDRAAIGFRLEPGPRRYNALWERIADYGKVYQWGRGGRTLAPDDLVRQRGGSSFSMREDYAEELSIADCVELIRTIESFNAYVESWCKSVPEQWAEYRKDWIGELLADSDKRLPALRREVIALCREARTLAHGEPVSESVRSIIRANVESLLTERARLYQYRAAVNERPFDAESLIEEWEEESADAE